MSALVSTTASLAAGPAGLPWFHATIDSFFRAAAAAGAPVRRADQEAVRLAAAQVATIIGHACADRPDSELGLTLRRSLVDHCVEVTLEHPGVAVRAMDLHLVRRLVHEVHEIDRVWFLRRHTGLSPILDLPWW